MENLKEKCTKCNGTGFDINKDFWSVCKKCNGWGELDWLEKIFGINKYMSSYELFKKFDKLVNSEKVNMEELIQWTKKNAEDVKEKDI